MSKATEMVLYRTCKRMIERGSTDGLAEKIDIFYAAGKLTDEHYAELTVCSPRRKSRSNPWWSMNVLSPAAGRASTA